MRLFFVLFISLIIWSCSKRTLINTNEYNQMIGGYSYLNGTVKEIIETPFKVVKDSLIPSFEGEWPWDNKVITRFNRNGQIQEQKIYKQNDSYWLSRSFYYKSKKSIIPDSSKTEFASKSFSDLMIYECNSETNIIFKLYRDSKLIFQSDQTYNKEYIPLKIIEGGKDPYRTVYESEYKNDTLLLKLYSEEEHIFTQKFTLNENNDWLCMNRENFNKNARNKIKTQSYSYVYDKKNNWIEKKIFDPKNILIYVYKREITYY